MACSWRRPYRRSTLTAALLIAALGSLGSLSAQQLPPIVRVYGSITVNGSNAPAGTVVTTSAGTTLCGTSMGAGLYDGSRYFVDVDSSQPACTAAGVILSFTAGGQRANETLQVPAIPGGAAALNLSVGTGGSVASVSYEAGWNLVSGPTGTLFSQASGSLFTLTAASGGSYTAQPPAQPVAAGQGYWAYFATAASVTLQATSQSTATAVAPAGQFIMVGNPNASRTATVSGADVVFTYTPGSGYTQTTQLAPGQGAWAYSAAGTTLTIS